MIKSISFKDNDTGWELEKINLSNLNLLIGSTGVGKTKILNTIFKMNDVGKKYGIYDKPNLDFEVMFNTNEKDYSLGYNSKKEYLWGNNDNSESLFNCAILHFINMFYYNKSTIIYPNFINSSRMINDDNVLMFPLFLRSEIMNYMHYKYISVIDFEFIKLFFIDIFSWVEDVKINNCKILIKEKNIKNWIPLCEMSSNMITMFKLIALIETANKNEIILIDELGNNLDNECLYVIQELINSRIDVQFIITTQVPWIVNNIPMEYWKVVTRKGNTTIVKDAVDYNLEKSKYQAYKQLINLEEYGNGVQ